HATLIEGAWPVPSGQPVPPADGVITQPIGVVVVQQVAVALGLHVGDVAPLVARASTTPATIPARIVGIFEIPEPTDALWNDDRQVLEGVRDTGTYRTLGPFFA